MKLSFLLLTLILAATSGCASINHFNSTMASNGMDFDPVPAIPQTVQAPYTQPYATAGGMVVY